MEFKISSGVQPSAVKVVLYGPEGIGKTTFASQFPNPLFILQPLGGLLQIILF